MKHAMPWNGNNFSYTQQAITTTAPNAPGVYAIWGTGETNATVYVGESNDIERRLLEHRQSQGGCINGYAPTTCGFELVAANERVARQNTLIAELTPHCNQLS